LRYNTVTNFSKLTFKKDLYIEKLETKNHIGRF
jgi:hypothetical protein